MEKVSSIRVYRGIDRKYKVAMLDSTGKFLKDSEGLDEICEWDTLADAKKMANGLSKYHGAKINFDRSVKP